MKAIAVFLTVVMAVAIMGCTEVRPTRVSPPTAAEMEQFLGKWEGAWRIHGYTGETEVSMNVKKENGEIIVIYKCKNNPQWRVSARERTVKPEFLIKNNEVVMIITGGSWGRRERSYDFVLSNNNLYGSIEDTGAYMMMTRAKE